MFPGSSVVEQLTVNQLVVGSNPSRGAILTKTTIKAAFTGGFFVEIISGSLPLGQAKVTYEVLAS